MSAPPEGVDALLDRAREIRRRRQSSPTRASDAAEARAEEPHGDGRARLGLVDGPTVKPPRFRLYTVDELDTLEDAAPLVAGDVLMRDSLATIVGAFATLKTFLAVDLAMSIANGMSWHGRAVHQGPVIYICSEGRRGMRRRIRAWMHEHPHPTPGPFYLLPDTVKITSADDVGELLALARRLDPPPVAVFVDTLARNFTGNENGQEDMSRFVDGADRIRRETGATIVAVHHTGWVAERSRGSNVLPASLDTEITVRRDGDRLTVTCTKQKDAAEFAPIEFQTAAVKDSLVLRPIGPNPAELSENQRTCLTALQRLNQTAGVTHGEWHGTTGLSSSSFNHALKTLVTKEYVARVGQRYHITVTGKAAIGPTSNGGPAGVQPVAGQEVQRAHVSRDVSDWTNPGATALGAMDPRVHAPAVLVRQAPNPGDTA